MKPKEPKDAQIVFADALICLANKPHFARLQIPKSRQWVDNLPVPRCIKRIHREIAARGILDQRG